MKIKKTFQGSIPENKIVNTQSDSQTDTYSCDYINNNVGIVESGSNENGNWIKYANGILKQYGKNTINTTTAVALPYGGYRSYGIYITFPIDFVDTPDSVIATSGSDLLDNGFSLNYSQITKNQLAGYWWAINSNSTGADHVVSWEAIGKWK